MGVNLYSPHSLRSTKRALCGSSSRAARSSRRSACTSDAPPHCTVSAGTGSFTSRLDVVGAIRTGHTPGKQSEEEEEEEGEEEEENGHYGHTVRRGGGGHPPSTPPQQPRPEKRCGAVVVLALYRKPGGAWT
jgi:hypothetical protein